MKYFILILGLVFTLTTSFYLKDNTVHNAEEEKQPYSTIISANSDGLSVEDLYKNIDFNGANLLNIEVFEKAFTGFNNLKLSGNLNEKSKYLTICDFSLSSTQKRLWVIDMEEKKVIFNTLVAHGKNTGEEFAQQFSNQLNSYQSSLGFYITETTYNGSNGYSLRLIGMDQGYNDAALDRAIVMHGADYVSESFISKQNRIGRSWGCPAVSRELAQPIIDTIKDKQCLFIYYPDDAYLQSSRWLKSIK